MFYRLIFLTLASFTASAKLPQGYGVSQSGNLVFVKTPFGSSIYIGPVGLDALDNYEFELPLSDFRLATNGSDSGKGSGGYTGDESSLISEANRLYNRGDFAHALQYVDEVSRRNPQNVRAWIMKGSLMHVMGHNDLAKQSYEKAHQLDPSNSQIENILKEMK